MTSIIFDVVKESYEELLHKYNEQKESCEELKKKTNSLSKRWMSWVDCVEEYRSEENEIMMRFISAHKTAEASCARKEKSGSDAFRHAAARG